MYYRNVIATAWIFITLGLLSMLSYLHCSSDRWDPYRRRRLCAVWSAQCLRGRRRDGRHRRWACRPARPGSGSHRPLPRCPHPLQKKTSLNHITVSIIENNWAKMENKEHALCLIPKIVLYLIEISCLKLLYILNLRKKSVKCFISSKLQLSE